MSIDILVDVFEKAIALFYCIYRLKILDAIACLVYRRRLLLF